MIPKRDARAQATGARWSALAFLLFVIGYLPVSGLIPFVYQKWSTVADRFLYLPMLGVALAATATHMRLRGRVARAVPWVLIAVLAWWSAWVQFPTWKDEGTLWQHSLRVTQHDPRAYLALGSLSSVRRDYREAIAYYDRALELEPIADGFISRGDARHALQQDDLARADYERAITVNPWNAVTYRSRSILFLAQGQPDSALVDAERALDFNRTDPRFYLCRANARVALGDFGRGIEDYDAAIALDPRLAAPYANRAIAYRSLGDTARAIEDLGRALERDPSMAFAYDNRARLEFLRGDPAAAEADLSRLVELRPADADALMNLARVHRALGRGDLALSDLRRVARLGHDVSAEIREIEGAEPRVRDR